MHVGVNGPTVKGTGKAIRETRKAQPASGVEASGAMIVEIRRGPPKLVVEGQKEILKQLRTEYRDGRLRMWVDGNTSTDVPVRAWYTGPNVSSFEGSGATEWDVSGLNAKTVDIGLSGASKAKVEGNASKLNVEATGASEANLKRLVATEAKLVATGASKIYATVKNSLNASASGASEIRYYGKAESIKQETSGASSVGPGK